VLFEKKAILWEGTEDGRTFVRPLFFIQIANKGALVNKGFPLFPNSALSRAGAIPTIFLPYSLIVLVKVVALVGRSLDSATLRSG
jgi:hypothetical protein